MNKIMWPGILFALIGASVIVHVVMLFIVSTDSSFAVDNRYRANTDPWWASVDRAQHVTPIDWNAVLELSPSESINGMVRLMLRVQDEDRRDVNDAVVELRMFHRAEAGNVVAAVLEPSGSGRYTALVPMHRDGFWKATVLMTRNDEQFARTFDLLAGR